MPACDATKQIYEWDENFRPLSDTEAKAKAKGEGAGAGEGEGPVCVAHLLDGTAIAPHDFSLTENYYVFVEVRVVRLRTV